MEDEYCLQEYYRATNKVQLVSMTSFVDSDAAQMSNSQKKKSDDYDNPWRKGPRPIKRSSTLYVKNVMATSSGLPSKPHQSSNIARVESDPSGRLSEVKSVTPITAVASHEERKCQNSESIPRADKEPKSVYIPRKDSTFLNEVPENIKTNDLKSITLALGGVSLQTKNELKDKLSDSLSPSPFKEVNQQNQENSLKQLVSCVKAKSLLLSPIYGSEVGNENSNNWKKALKDYILHMLQSIGIIKKLSEVPSKLLASKSVKLDKNSESIFLD